MAISINFNGATLHKPGVYSKTRVDLTGGFPIAPAGIVAILGEAERGAPGSSEDIKENFYSPEALEEVVDKYGSGPIVDAFRLLLSPSNDARIANGANRVFIYKTNGSTRASSALPTSYGTLNSKNWGKDENSINFITELSQAEIGPQYTDLNWIPDEGTTSAVAIRINGETEQTLAISAATTPAALVTAWNGAISGLLADGGTSRNILIAGDVGVATLALVADNDLQITITKSTVWTNLPIVGDTLYIPTGSVIAGGGSENIGGYIVTAVTTTTVTAIKLSDLGTVVTGVGATLIAAVTDTQSFDKINLTYDDTTPEGVGAAIEIYDDGGSQPIEELLYGGEDREVLSTTQVNDGSTLSLTVISSANIEIDINTSFAAVPSPGDLLWIAKASSPLSGLSNENVGSYLVTSATPTKISATKITGSPASVTAADITATDNIQIFKGILSTSTIPLLTVSSAEKKIMITLKRDVDGFSEDSGSIGGNTAMEIGYDGTTATLSITSSKLTTTVTGGSGANLDLELDDYATIQALADFIDTQTGYTASVSNAVIGAQSPSILDRVSSVGISSEEAGLTPGRIKRDSSLVQNFFDNTILVSLSRLIFVGLPTVISAAEFLSGGSKGGTSAASIVDGLDELQKVRVNSVVPLFSRDAIDDILDSLTEPSSTYQISAINAAAKSHVLLMSNTIKRSERNAYCSIKSLFSDAIDESQRLASERVSLALQDINILKTDGTLDFVQPWGLSCIAAGMQAGASVGEPMTFKFVNISGLQHTDFDSRTDVDAAIDAGLLFAEQPDQGGFRMVVGNTTYGRDANFVFNRISVLYVADTVAFNLRQQLEAIFVGVSTAIADAQSIKNTTISILNTFRAGGLLVGDDTNGGTGFKNLNVRIEGNVVRIDVTITPAQGIDFILPTLVLDNIRQTA